MKKFFLILVCGAVLLTSCDKREQEQLPVFENGTAVSVSEIEFDPTGGDYTFAVSSVIAYQFVDVPEWITIYNADNGSKIQVDGYGKSSEMAAGTASFRVVATYNSNRPKNFQVGDYRDQTLSIRSCDKTFNEEIYLKQEYPYLNVFIKRPSDTAPTQIKNSHKFAFDWNYTSQSPFECAETLFTVECNTDWSIAVLNEFGTVITSKSSADYEADVPDYLSVRSDGSTVWADWLKGPSTTEYHKCKENSFDLHFVPVTYNTSATRALTLVISNPKVTGSSNSLDKYQVNISQNFVRFNVTNEQNEEFTSIEFPSCYTTAQLIKVDSELEWYPESDCTWVELKKSSTNVTANVSHAGCSEGANNKSEEQSGNITIWGYVSKEKDPNLKISKTISVTQAPYYFNVLNASSNTTIANTTFENKETVEFGANVKSSGDWEVTSTHDWVTLSAEGGKGSGGSDTIGSESLLLTTSNYNLDTNNLRETTITVKSKLNSMQKSFKITQPKYVFTATAPDLSLLTFDTASHSLKVESTGAWEIETDYTGSANGNEAWLNFSSLNGTTGASVTYKAKTGNGYTEDRKATVKVISIPHKKAGLGDDVAKTFDIVQSKYIFEVTPSFNKFAYQAVATTKTYMLNIDCSADWTIEAPSWINVKRSGSGSEELTVSVQNNYSYISRDGNIVVKSTYEPTGSTYTKSIPVSQESFIFDVSPQTISSVPAFIGDNDRFGVTINSSAPWSIEKDTNYSTYVKSVSKLEGEADSSEKIYFVPNHNPNKQGRTFDVTIRSAVGSDEGMEKTITFTQEAYQFDEASKEYNYSSLSANVEEANSFKVICSGNWELQSKPSWVNVNKLTHTPQESGDYATLKIEVANNYELTQRGPEEMFIYSPIGGYKQKITISQAAFKFDTTPVTDLTQYTALSPKDQTVTILEGDAGWRLESKPDWILLDADAGSKGLSYVNLKAKENTYLEPRSGKVRFVSNYYSYNNKLYKDVDVSQAAFKFDTAEVTLDKYSALSPSSQSVTVQECDGNWSVKNTLDWVTVEKANNSVKVSVAENVNKVGREGTIRLESEYISSNSALCKVIKLSQAAFEFDETKASLSYAALPTSSQTVQIGKCDGTWTVTGVPSWISVNKSNGGGNTTIEITAAPNYVKSSRSETIRLVSDKNNSIYKEISVSQAAFKFDTTVATLTEYASLPTSGQTVQIGECDGRWTIESKPDWITVNQSTGTGSMSITVTAQNNIEKSSRSGSIRLVSEYVSNNAELCKIINVSQAAFKFDTEPASVSFGAASNLKTTVTLGESDGSWRVEGVPSWITMVSSGSGSTQITLEATVNSSLTDSRTETIRIVSESNSNYHKEISVTQSAFKFDTNDVKVDVFTALSPAAKTVDVGTCDGTWNVVNNYDWVTVTKNGADAITISVSENNQKSPREGTIRLESEYINLNPRLYKEIKVSQAAFKFDTEPVTANTFGSVTNLQATITLGESDGCWHVEDAPDWIKVLNNSGVGASDIIFAALANSQRTPRSATVKVVSDNNSSYYKSVTFSQQAMTFDNTSVLLTEYAALSSSEQTVEVVCDGEWSVSAPSWIKVTPSSGTGSMSIMVAADANYYKSNRQGEVLIKSKYWSDNSELCKVVNVSQAAFQFDDSEATVDEFTALSPVAKTVSVGACDGTWNVVNNYDWVTVEKSNNSVTVSVKENVNKDGREGIIRLESEYISGNSALCKVIKLSQAAFEFDEAKASLSYAALPSSSQTVQIGKCDGTWTVVGAPSWISVNKSNGGGNTTIEITAEPNYVKSSRSETIRLVSDKNNSIYKEISVSQAAFKFDTAPNTINFSAMSAEEQSVLVGECDGEWVFEIVDNASWIHVVRAENTLKVTVDNNTGSKSRPGTILVKSNYFDKNDALVKTITVQQDPYLFNVAESSVVMAAEGGVSTIGVSCSGNWNYVADKEWIALEKVANGLKVTVEANTAEARSGEIIISSTDNAELTATISVTQSAVEVVVPEPAPEPDPNPTPEQPQTL